MHDLYNLKDLLCKELKEYGNKGNITTGTLDVIDKLAHAIKNIDKIIMMHEDEEYSNADGNSYDNSYDSGSRAYVRPDGSYRHDVSNARGRGRGARRDSMGRYSRAGGDMISELRELMENAPNDRTRNELRSFIDKMERMQ